MFRQSIANVIATLLLLVGPAAIRPATAQTYRELYRLYNGTDHFYTVDREEVQRAIIGGYGFEEVLGSVATRQLKGTLPLFRLWNGRDHFYTTDIVERGRAESPSVGYHFENIVGYVPSGSVSYAATAPVYRLFNGTDHFYTGSIEERGFARGVGYTLESTPFYVFVTPPWTTAHVPLYRLFNGVDHFYTTDFLEAARAQVPPTPVSSGIEPQGPYHAEGISGFVAVTQEAGTVPLYRLFNGTDHFYTTDLAERNRAEGIGYRYERIAGYLRATPANGWVQFNRLYNGTDHFYTANRWEVGNAEGANYHVEPSALYIRFIP